MYYIFASSDVAMSGAGIVGSILLFAFFAFLAFLAILVYFAPVIIAMMRGHKQTLAIAAVNVLLGWSFVGWVIALVWALTKDDSDRIIVVK